MYFELFHPTLYAINEVPRATFLVWGTDQKDCYQSNTIMWNGNGVRRVFYFILE